MRLGRMRETSCLPFTMFQINLVDVRQFASWSETLVSLKSLRFVTTLTRNPLTSDDVVGGVTVTKQKAKTLSHIAELIFTLS